MNKCVASLVAACMAFVFSVPAMAEDKTMEDRMKALESIFGGLSFYGSARFDTFYEKSDSKFVADGDKVTGLTSGSPLLTGPGNTMGPGRQFPPWRRDGQGRRPGWKGRDRAQERRIDHPEKRLRYLYLRWHHRAHRPRLYPSFRQGLQQPGL